MNEPQVPGVPRDEPASDGSVLARLRPGSAEVLPVLLRELEGEAGGAMVMPARGVGESEGRYRVLGEIARGGVGIVLKGYDVDLGRNVAMKVIRKEYEGYPEVVQRFVEEAQIGGQLQHPGIVPVYEIGLGKGRQPYFTMKLVKGKTFAALLAARADLAKDRHRDLTIFASICQTMAYAHARGVIHRDLKPANVMVGAFGEVLVLDWGMGKVLREGGVEDERRAAAKADETFVATLRSAGEGSQSMVGSVLGTPRYMPPEQARGSTDLMDERSDVFALGGILTEILTGEPTYRGPDGEILRMAARGDVADATRRLADCGADRELTELALACLAPAREVRPANAGEVAETVLRYLASLEGRAQAARLEAAEAHGRAEQERRARKLTALLAALVVLVVLGVGATWWWLDRRRSEREAKAGDQVTSALQEAAQHGSGRRWTEALAASTRAVQLAESASADLRARAAATHAEVTREAEAAALAERLAASNRELLAALERAHPVEADDRYPTDWTAADRLYHEAFAAQGLDPGQGTAAEAAGRMARRGISSELAAALDGWALARRRIGDEAGHRRLVEVADLFDADGVRARIRRAIAGGEADALTALASDEDLLRRPLETLRLLGSGLTEVGAYEAAATMLARAHRRHPGDHVLCLLRARALHLAGRWEESARYYIATLALRPGAAIVYAEAGQELLNLGEFARAEQVFRDGLERWPEDGVMHGQLAVALVSLGRAEEALQEVEAAVRFAPRNPWVRNIQAGILLAVPGRKAEAIAAAEEALRLAPLSGDVCAEASRNFSRAEQFERAAELAERAATLPSRSPTAAHVRLAEAMASVGRPQAGIDAAREALRRGPHSAEAHHALGVAAFGVYRFEESVAALGAATRINPRDANSWWGLTNVYRYRGDYGQALRSLERVGELLGAAVMANDPMLVKFSAELRTLAAAEPRYLAILEGHLPAAHAQEMIQAAVTGCYRDHPYGAYRQMRAAFDADPAKVRLPTEDETHFGGACAAARMLEGVGDAPSLSPEERAAVAEQGYEWLREALELRRADKPPTERRRLLEIWIHTPYLAGLREPEAVARLPAEVQPKLRAFWEQVHATVAEARAGR